MIDRYSAFKLLARQGQDHVLRWFDKLDDAGQARLLNQIKQLDLDWLERVYSTTLELAKPEAITPYHQVILEGDAEESQAIRLGETALRAGRVATLLVAGGQGTRLGFDGPKGLFPIGAVSGHTLFQILAERQVAIGRRYGVVPPLYVMTSDSNHQATLDYFTEHNCFSIPKERLFIFQQGLVPAVDECGRLLLEAPDRLVLTPSGNGGLFSALYRSGAIKHMRDHGVDTISYIQVDNPLAPNCDPRFIGYHLLRESHYSCKAIRKLSPEERVGCYALVRGKLRVVEYTELPEHLAQQRDEQSELLFGYSNPGLFIWSRDFIKAQALRQDLPFHKAYKKISHIDEHGNQVNPNHPCGYKFEAFAMDTLPDAPRSLVLACHREVEFAPVKNALGDDSPESARWLMTQLYATWLRQAGGRIQNPQAHIEISPLFALDAEELQAQLPASLVIDNHTFLGPLE